MVLTKRSRVRELFEQHFLPHRIEDPDSVNVDGYRRAIHYWERITEDPPLEDISSVTMSEFKAGLVKQEWRGKPLHVNTVVKYLSHLQWILDQAGPSGPRQLRTALGLLAYVPYTRPPKRVRQFKRMVPEVHIVKFFHACEHAVLPAVSGLTASALWRALLATIASTSLRIGQLVETPMSAVHFDEQLLVLPAGICRKSKTEEPHPLHPFAMRMLVAIRGDRERLFPFFPKPHSKTTIYHEAHRLQDLAGVPHFGFHGMRRSTLTALSAISPAAGQLAAGHSSYETTKLYQDLELLQHAVSQLTLFDKLA